MSSDDYLSRLLQSIHETYPNLVDPHVLSNMLPSLLLALVARDTNIVFNTPATVDIQKYAVKALSTIFGLKTKRVRIRSPQSPHDLLTSLFASSSPASSSGLPHRPQPSYATLSRSQSAPRPSSSQFTEGSDSTAPHPLHSRHKTDPLPREFDVQPSLSLPQTVVISGLERAGRVAQLALADVLRNRRITLEPQDGDRSVWVLPDGFFIVFVSHIGNGHERPAIHTTLLDHFAFSITLTQTAPHVATSSPSPLLRPLPLSPQSRKPPLLPFDQISRPDSSELVPSISHYITALISAARHHPEVDGTLLTARCVRDAEKLVRASGVVFQEGDVPSMISELHVRRIVPPVLAHRLRVRDGPREQIMGALWEGAGLHRWRENVEDPQKSRRTIKICCNVCGRKFHGCPIKSMSERRRRCSSSRKSFLQLQGRMRTQLGVAHGSTLP